MSFELAKYCLGESRGNEFHSSCMSIERRDSRFDSRSVINLFELKIMDLRHYKQYIFI